MANLNIVIPPVTGAQQADQQIAQIGRTAQTTAKQIDQIGSGQRALVGIHGSAVQATGGFNGLAASITRNAGSAQYLLRTIAPLGGQFGIMAAQIERGMLMIERMTGAAEQHVSKQTVLNQAFQAGAISAATMEAALAKVVATTQAAQAATIAFAQAQSAVVVAQRASAQAALLVQQRRLDVSTAKAGGDEKAQALATRDLAAAQAGQLEANIALRQQMLATAPLRAQAVQLTREQAEAERVLAAASSAATFSLAATIGVITGAIAALVALAGALYVVTKSLAAAGREQTLDTTFKGLIGNAKEAAIALEQLKAFRGAAGIFQLEDLEQAAIHLKNAGAATQNVVGYTEALAAAAARVHVSVDSMANAFIQAMVGRMQRPTSEMLLLLRQVAIDTGTANDKVRTMFQNATPEQKIKLLTTALQNMAREGGVAFNAIQERQANWEDALAVLHTRWQTFLEAFGRPVIDALTPILTRMTDKMEGSQSTASTWGQGVAKAFEAVTHQVQLMVTEIEKAIQTLQRWIALANRWNPMNPAAWTGTALGPPASSLMMRPPPGATNPPVKENILRDIEKVNPALDELVGGLEHGNQAVKDINAQLQKQALLLEKIRFAADLINQNVFMSPDAKQAALLATTTQELTAVGAAIQQDNQLLAQAKGLGDASTIERVNAELVKMGHEYDVLILKQKELRFPWQTEFAKAADAFGTFQHQVVGSAVEIGNSLSSNVSSGLTDILNGTKSVAQGFRDMATSIIRDIERIIIQQLVELQIQRLLAAFGGVGLGSAWPAGTMSVAVQTGGKIPGSGSGDHVPILAEPGEFMLTKRAARRIGYRRLHEWNKMAGGGNVAERYNERNFWVYDDWGHRIVGASPSWFTSPTAQGPPDMGQGPPDLIDISNPITPSTRSGPQVYTPRWQDIHEAWRDVYTPHELSSFNQLGNLGYFPPVGTPGYSQGPTMIPTTFNPQGYPRAVPVGPGTDVNINPGYIHTSGHRATKHEGGVIGSFHSGGIIGIDGYAAGGMVSARTGEGVFTPAQMRALGGSTTTVVNNIRIENNGRVTSASSGGGMNDGDLRAMGRMIAGVVEGQIAKHRRTGGMLYAPRSG